jgi:peroxiredoxin
MDNLTMKKLLPLFPALVWIAGAASVSAAEAKVQLQALIEKVNTKLQAGNATEQDLAPELNEYDALLAEHKAEKTDDVAEILFMKGMLYGQVLGDYAQAVDALRQVKVRFPGTADAGKVDPLIAAFAQEEEAKKIQDSLVVGVQFPDFAVKDLAGKPLSVASEKGRIVLIDFWATWCDPCVAELPNVLEVYEKNHDKGFDIIGVSLDTDKEQLTGFMKKRNLTWPQYFDDEGGENKLAVKYGVNTIPATYLLGRDGKIIGKNLRGEALDSAVTAALAAK